MGLSTSYTNELGQAISFQQASDLNGYFKLFSEDNVLIKKEYYVNEILKNTSYIVSSQSDIDSILVDHPTVSFEYLYSQSTYYITELTAYVQSILIEKRINVFNATNGIICSKWYKVINNVLTSVSTEKYYFDNTNEEKYYFTYNNDGTCFQIFDLQIDDADFYAWDIGVNPDVTFTWSGFEYYENADPLIPNR